MATINSWNNTITDGSTITLNGVLNLGTDTASNGISIGLGTTAKTVLIGTSAANHFLTIGSTNTTAATTLNYANSYIMANAISGNLITIDTSNQVKKPSTPAFLGYLATTRVNVSGNATSYTLGVGTALTVVFNQKSHFGVSSFTAAQTGRHQFQSMIKITDCTIATTVNINIVTSNRTYTLGDGRAASSINFGIFRGVLADMDAGDTCTTQINTVGEAAATNDIVGGATVVTTFNGYLVC